MHQQTPTHKNESELKLGHTQTQVSSPTKRISRKYTKKQTLISEYQSQSKQQFIEQESLIKLRDVMLKIKINRIAMIFINKLKNNSRISTRFPYLRKSKNYRVVVTRVLQVIYHVIIALHYLSILLLLLLTSWTATLNQFGQNAAMSSIVYAIKISSLTIFVLQQIANFISHFFKHQISLSLTSTNIKQQLFSYNYINNLIKIILLIFFIIFPKNHIVAAFYFIFLVISLFIGVTQLAHLQAVYIHTEKRSMIWKVSKILGLNILMIHIVSTILMAMTHINYGNNWFIKYDLMDSSWHYQYITSYYWATIIVTTIGFGDISPQTTQEQLIIAFLALIACILLAFNITMFSQVFAKLKDHLQSVQLKTVMFRRMIRRDYKNNVDIDSRIKKKIYQYIDNLSNDKRQLQFIQKNQFLNQLPSNLRSEYYKNTNKRLFSSIFFLNTLRNTTLSALSQKFSILFLSANDHISPSDLQIKVLQSGRIGLTYFRMESTINGKVYDEIKVDKRENVVLLNSDFLSLEKLSNFKMVTLKFSIVWTINLDNFINILRNDVIDFQYYFSILHKYSFDENQWETLDCPRCSTRHYRQKHSCFRCPVLTYIPIRKIAIYKSCVLPETEQQRKVFTRNKDIAPRTSVLKYWKNYLKKNIEMEHKRDVTDHVQNILKKKSSKISKILRKSNQKLFNRYYLDKQRQQIIQQERYLNFDVDIPFNFQYYFPKFNPDQLIFTHVQTCYGAQLSSTILVTLRNVMHVKGHKFNKHKLGR